MRKPLPLPRVVMMSLWRNDVQRQLNERVAHLLGKSYPNLRWVWVVGDCEDDTEKHLRALALAAWDKSIEIVRHDTQIAGEEPETRLRRLSLTANAGFDRVRDDDDYWLIHESDINSPVNLVERFLETGKCPVAGWPWLGEAGSKTFYDIMAYRKNGAMFSNNPPYSECYRDDELFEVDSFGTVYMFHAQDVRDGLRCEDRAVLEICDGLKERGRRLWVDPTIEVLQPLDLWVPQKTIK
jgi:hypothetical protein